MPRSDKSITPGSLDAGRTSSRVHQWTKYGSQATSPPEDVNQSPVEVSVDDVTVVSDPNRNDSSKFDYRTSSAHVESTDRVEHVPSKTTEWVVDRSIEGRTYRRTDVTLS